MAETKKQVWLTNYRWDILVCIVLLIIPFTLYSYLLFDTDSNALSIWGISIKHGFSGNNIFIYYILIKIIPILLLSLWFLNTPYWWRYFIFSPIILYFFNLVKTFDPDGLIIWQMKLVGLLLTFFLIGLILLVEPIVLKIVGRDKISPSFLEILQSGIKKTYKSLHPQLRVIRSQQNTNKNKKYLTRLFGLQLLLNNRLSKTPFVKKPFYLKKHLEYFLILVLLLIPAIYYLHLFLPEGEKISRIFGLPIKSYGFPDTCVFIWFICQKICILIPLSMWFIVSRTWWKNAILSPIILYTFQIWQTFQEVNNVDESEIITAFPFVLIVVITLIVLSSFVKYYSKTMDIYEDISDEIEGLLDEINPEKALINQKKSEFEKLKANITLEKGEERLQSLLKLRDELLLKINSSN